MTVPCAGIWFESQARGGSWVDPVTEANATSNAAIEPENKQARSEFSLLGLERSQLTPEESGVKRQTNSAEGAQQDRTIDAIFAAAIARRLLDRCRCSGPGPSRGRRPGDPALRSR